MNQACGNDSQFKQKDLVMKIGFCSPLNHAKVIANAGADFLEIGVSRDLMPLETETVFEENLRVIEASPLPSPVANLFLPGKLQSTGPDFAPDAIADYAATACQRAQRIGIRHIVFGSGGSRQLEDGFPADEAWDQFVELCHRIAPIASDHGVTIVIEPLRRQECNFINTVAEGARIVEQTNHPGVMLLADLFHMIENGETADDLTAVVEHVQHVHVAEPETRTAPGVKGCDFVPFFKVLNEAGYPGAVSIEAQYPDGIETDAARAVETLRVQLGLAGF